MRVLGMVYWGGLGIECGVVILVAVEWCIWLVEGVWSICTFGSFVFVRIDAFNQDYYHDISTKDLRPVVIRSMYPEP